uniref:J domain-containing protein n=1 Tax=Graphocephala atropunctata TaxID=36148 RepID=A0A1B6L9M6_9HEMI
MYLNQCSSTVNLQFVRFITLVVSKYKYTNYYERLKITPQATQRDVKTAYYELSKKCHPDMNRYCKGASLQFKNISEAYNILKNPNSRMLYDRDVSFIRTNKYDNIQNSPVVENYEPFGSHEKKPPAKKRTGKMSPLQVDEWTRIHYSHTFHEAYNLKRELNKNIEQMKEEDERVWHVTTLLFIFSVIYFSFGVKQNCTEANK